MASTQSSRSIAPHSSSLQTRYFAVRSGTIAYDDVGSGPVVICVPSIGDVRAEYRFLRPYLLDAGFRVVTVDIRGHGESSARFRDYSAPAVGDDILALARHLDAGPVSVIGTSKAGGSAAWAAAHGPGLIRSLVLVDSFVRVQEGGGFLKVLLNLMLLRPWGPALWTMYFPNFYPTRKPDDFAAYRLRLKANLAEPGRIEALRAMMNDSPEAAAAVEKSLANVRVPALVVMGTKDPDFHDPQAEADWIALQVGGHVLMVPDAGHYPHAEMPDQVGPQIAAFLAQAPHRAS